MCYEADADTDTSGTYNAQKELETKDNVSANLVCLLNCNPAANGSFRQHECFQQSRC